MNMMRDSWSSFCPKRRDLPSGESAKPPKRDSRACRERESGWTGDGKVEELDSAVLRKIHVQQVDSAARPPSQARQQCSSGRGLPRHYPMVFSRLRAGRFWSNTGSCQRIRSYRYRYHRSSLSGRGSTDIPCMAVNWEPADRSLLRT
jgi:hypothetical protein